MKGNQESAQCVTEILDIFNNFFFCQEFAVQIVTETTV